MKFKDLFSLEKPIIGMLHLKALPGAPLYKNSFKHVLERALNDAKALIEGGVDALILENFGDVPFYPDQVPVHTISYMTRIAREVKHKFDITLGINVLRNDARAAIAIASATGAEFIRVNVHTGCMVTDQGIIQGKAHETLRMRKNLQNDVLILADVLVKHALPLVAQSPDQAARDTFYRGQADGLIVSGSETGIAPDIKRIQAIKNAVPTAPILIGSGLTLSNLENYLDNADGFIIGTWFKFDEITTNPVDYNKVQRFMEKVRELRELV